MWVVEGVEVMEEMVEMKEVTMVGTSRWALLGGAAAGGRWKRVAVKE